MGSALLLGEMLTATAMTHFEAEISKAVVLAQFVPLIISSSGNSGSQSSTLVVRAMALGEVRLKDWWRVMFGTTAGSMLPFLLRRARLDPATASAPFVATLVDVTGLIIDFSVAAVVLRGTLYVWRGSCRRTKHGWTAGSTFPFTVEMRPDLPGRHHPRCGQFHR